MSRTTTHSTHAALPLSMAKGTVSEHEAPAGLQSTRPFECSWEDCPKVSLLSLYLRYPGRPRTSENWLCLIRALIANPTSNVTFASIPTNDLTIALLPAAPKPLFNEAHWLSTTEPTPARSPTAASMKVVARNFQMYSMLTLITDNILTLS